MATPNVDWKDQKWMDVITRSFATTAKSRAVIPKGGDQIGMNTITVPQFAYSPGIPIKYGTDVVETTVQIYADMQIDDFHLNDAGIAEMIAQGATALGAEEDRAILHGVPPSGGVVPTVGSMLRNPSLACGQVISARIGKGITTTIAGGPTPSYSQIIAAVAKAITALGNAQRPGAYGLVLQNDLMAILTPLITVGTAPPIQAIEELIGGNHIAGTSALPLAGSKICGVLFRLDPAAIDLVQTQPLSLTLLGRSGGYTDLRVEEDIALRVRDPAAIHFLDI